MRLNRLDLIRYGRFSNAQIVLPLPKGDAADVTVIYGANEAGKSTTFTGFLELLFGMKPRDHPYAFQFDRNDLLIGAELDLPGRGPTILRRNGKRKQSLVDDQGRPLDEAVLTSALHGLGREAYVERFSLDDEGLRKGGARIADAEGDLGQLLHAGVSGLTSMANTLEQMGAGADQFYKKGGRGSRLKIGKDRLSEIARELRAQRFTPDRERALRETCQTASQQFQNADDALQSARRRSVAQTAAQEWYKRSGEIEALDLDLAKFPDGPDLPQDAGSRSAALVTTIAEKEARIVEADAKIARHVAVIAENQPDPIAGELAAELAALDQLMIDNAPLMSRAETAASDLGNRIAQRDALGAQMDQLLIALNMQDRPASTLVLPPEEIDTLAQAAQFVLTCRMAMTNARDAVTAALAGQTEAPEQPQDLSHLQAAWEVWQQVADVSGQESNVALQTARLASAVSGLPEGWPALVKQGIATRETLAQVADEIVQIIAQKTAAEGEVQERESELGLCRAQSAADAAGPSALDIAASEATRALRQQRWADHRRDLSAKTADAFENAMQQDDAARANYLMGAQARQQLAASRRAESAAQARFDQSAARLEGLNKSHVALTERAAALAKALGLAGGTNPASFVARHDALIAAAAAATELGNAQASLDALCARRDLATNALSEAAILVGLDGAATGLGARVRAALTLQDSVRQTWEAWTRAQKALVELQQVDADARAQLDASQQALEIRTSTFALPDASADGVLAAVPRLRDLQRMYSEHLKLGVRVEALERAVEQLARGAQRIEALGGAGDTADPSPMAVISAARHRLHSTEQAALLAQAEEARLEQESHEKARAAEARAAAMRDLDAIVAGQAGTGSSTAETITHLIARDALRAQKRVAQQARLTARSGVDAALFEEECAALPDATRQAIVQQLVEDAQLARDAARDAHTQAERLLHEAYQAADASHLATEQATLTEELRSGARRAVVARLGVMAAKGALRRLASERRNSMLQDVEEAFVTMTAPAWKKVDVWSQDEGDKLVGVQPDGKTVPVEAMSTGTMGQLYFALRLAGYRSFARDLGPLPMILDDIMETFDDTRARAALELCAQIGRSGQAIIFTHHAHLVALARETIPDVGIVEMPR